MISGWRFCISASACSAVSGARPGALHQHFAELGVLALELREHDDVVVDLRDGLVEDDGRRLLLRARGRGGEDREHERREGQRQARRGVFQLHSH